MFRFISLKKAASRYINNDLIAHHNLLEESNVHILNVCYEFTSLVESINRINFNMLRLKYLRGCVIVRE
jgi:hypothetical protein